MELYKSNGLTPTQNIHKNLFSFPRDSLVNGAIAKIEDLNDFIYVKYHANKVRTETRLHVLSIPFLALADTGRYLFRCTQKIIKLEKDSALYNFLSCAKSLKVFFFSIISIVAALISPETIYHTEKNWKKILKENFQTSLESIIKNKPSDASLKETVKDAFINLSNKLIKDTNSKEIVNSIIETIDNQFINIDKEKEEIVAMDYIELFADFLARCVHGNIALNRANDDFCILANSFINLRSPELRLHLMQNLLKVFKKNPLIISGWKILSNNVKENLYIPLFLLCQMTNDSEILSKFIQLLSKPYFKDQIKLADSIGILFKLLTTKISNNKREKTLKLIVDCYEFDLSQIVKNEKSENPGISLNGLKKQIAGKEKLINKKKETVKELRDKKESEERIKQIETNIENLTNELEKLKVALQTQENQQPAENPVLAKKSSDSLADFLKGCKNLNLLLSLQNLDLFKNLISQIGKDQKYNRLSSDQLIEDLFQTTFQFETKIENLAQSLSKLRAPDALILFHSRLQELSGKKRNEALIASRKFAEHALKGDIWEERHNENENPHLKKIFDAFPDLKEKWMDRKPAKVSDFVPKQESKKYANYSIEDTRDPCDTILIGSEMNTCVHLNGRVIKIVGLLGFALDGKIHTIVVKNEKGQICSETQLILMWDKTDEKPVLFQEYINFKSQSPDDTSLEKATQLYCKQIAQDLNLDLITVYGDDNNEGQNNKNLSQYPGKICSLGSSAPLEHVNVFNELRSRVYDLGQTYLLQKAEAIA